MSLEDQNAEVLEKRKDNDGLHRRRGVWHFKVKDGGRWREMSSHTSNYQDARKVRRQTLQAQEEGRLPTDLSKWHFEKAATQWLASRCKLVAPQTYRIDKDRLRPLLKAFGGRRLCEICSGDVRAYQSARAGEVGHRTINLETKVLRMILRTGKVWAHVADDYKALPEDKSGPGRALSPEQERMLFHVASSNPRWNVAYYAAQLAANTTARSCELKGLRLRDIDLLARSMTIRRSSTKTNAGCRVIPLNEVAVRAAVRLLERAKALGASEPEHCLFPSFEYRKTKNGNQPIPAGFDPTSPMKTWRTAWRSLTRAAALPGLALPRPSPSLHHAPRRGWSCRADAHGDCRPCEPGHAGALFSHSHAGKARCGGGPRYNASSGTRSHRFVCQLMDERLWSASNIYVASRSLLWRCAFLMVVTRKTRSQDVHTNVHTDGVLSTRVHTVYGLLPEFTTEPRFRLTS
jgi:integrase